MNISPDMLSDEGQTRLDALAHTAEVGLSFVNDIPSFCFNYSIYIMTSLLLYCYDDMYTCIVNCMLFSIPVLAPFLSMITIVRLGCEVRVGFK